MKPIKVVEKAFLDATIFRCIKMTVIHSDEEFHSKGITYDFITSTCLRFFVLFFFVVFFSKFFNRITEFNNLFIGPFFVVVLLFEQIVAVVIHCLALLNLVAFLDYSSSSWEELVLVRVHYLTVGSALPHGFVVEASIKFLLPYPPSVFPADPDDFVVVVC